MPVSTLLAWLSNLPDLTKFLSWRLARGHQRKTPPQVGPARGFQRAVRLGGLTPGLRTERRGQDDTPKRKMMRARLPSIAKGLIQFECGTDTTVGAIPGPPIIGYSCSSPTSTASVQSGSGSPLISDAKWPPPNRSRASGRSGYPSERPSIARRASGSGRSALRR